MMFLPLLYLVSYHIWLKVNKLTTYAHIMMKRKRRALLNGEIEEEEESEEEEDKQKSTSQNKSQIFVEEKVVKQRT